MAQHVGPITNDEGKRPSPAEQIVIDVMAATLSCISVKIGNKADHASLIDCMEGQVLAWGFSDDGLVALLREKGYHVEMTDSAFTVSQSH